MSEINRENGGEEHAAVELAATEPEEVEPEAERILRITLTCWHVFVRENFDPTSGHTQAECLSETSKFCAMAWREMDAASKQIYKEKAEEMRAAAAALICYACKKKHSKLSAWRSHVRYCGTERPKPTCATCHKTFSCKSNLNRHLKLHLPKDEQCKFFCKKCNAVVNLRKDNLNQHNKRFH